MEDPVYGAGVLGCNLVNNFFSRGKGRYPARARQMG